MNNKVKYAMKMTDKFRLNLDDLNEEITLDIIDEILMSESLLDSEELKFSELVSYVTGIRTIYITILAYSDLEWTKETDIPLIITIVNIDNAVTNNKINEKEAWNQIKDLIKRASELTKCYKKEPMLDIYNLREIVTINVIKTFQNLDIKLINGAGEVSKLCAFSKFIEGIIDAYDNVLYSLDLELSEETEMPLINTINDVADAWFEERLTGKDAWNQIKDLIERVSS